jgi:hypothetical protein
VGRVEEESRRRTRANARLGRLSPPLAADAADREASFARRVGRASRRSRVASVARRVAMGLRSRRMKKAGTLADSGGWSGLAVRESA